MFNTQLWSMSCYVSGLLFLVIHVYTGSRNLGKYKLICVKYPAVLNSQGFLADLCSQT